MGFMSGIETTPDGGASECPASEICVDVDPGICGFRCNIGVVRLGPRAVEIEIRGSGCRQIQRLSEKLGRLSLKELFMPLTKNPVFIAAEASGCHTSCIVPTAVLKAVEAALEMALPKETSIRFLPANEKTLNE